MPEETKCIICKKEIKETELCGRTKENTFAHIDCLNNFEICRLSYFKKLKLSDKIDNNINAFIEKNCGVSYIAYLLDSDENDGERLRQKIKNDVIELIDKHFPVCAINCSEQKKCFRCLLMEDI